MSEKPRLLDLFAGAGGAARGYQLAGFHVTGIDHIEQPNYAGDEFSRGDALCVLNRRGWVVESFDAIHASPPCQKYSRMTRNMGIADDRADLVGATRELLEATGLPYVIENVEGAPLLNPVMLCGTSLGLGASGMDLPRHRLFECNFPVMGVPCSRQHSLSMGVYGNGTNSWHREKLGRNLTVDEQREAMGIDWMARDRLSQAIPPAMTEHIGGYLLTEIAERRKVAAQ